MCKEVFQKVNKRVHKNISVVFCTVILYNQRENLSNILRGN